MPMQSLNKDVSVQTDSKVTGLVEAPRKSLPNSLFMTEKAKAKAKQMATEERDKSPPKRTLSIKKSRGTDHNDKNFEIINENIHENNSVSQRSDKDDIKINSLNDGSLTLGKSKKGQGDGKGKDPRFLGALSRDQSNLNLKILENNLSKQGSKSSRKKSKTSKFKPWVNKEEEKTPEEQAAYDRELIKKYEYNLRLILDICSINQQMYQAPLSKSQRQ